MRKSRAARERGRSAGNAGRYGLLPSRGIHTSLYSRAVAGMRVWDRCSWCTLPIREVAPRFGHPASLYLLHPWSRAYPCARDIRASMHSTKKVTCRDVQGSTSVARGQEARSDGSATHNYFLSAPEGRSTNILSPLILSFSLQGRREVGRSN